MVDDSSMVENFEEDFDWEGEEVVGLELGWDGEELISHQLRRGLGS